MKLKFLTAVLAVMLYQGTASAETLMGTVTNVDATGKKVTIMRTDTNQSVTLNVRDAKQFSTLRTGAHINVDANNKAGSWEVRKFNPSPVGNSLSASTSTTSGSLSSNSASNRTASSVTAPMSTTGVTSSGSLAGNSTGMANSASVNGSSANSGVSASGTASGSAGSSAGSASGS